MTNYEKQGGHNLPISSNHLKSALVCSFMIHAIGMNSERLGQLWSEKESIVYVAQQRMRAALESRPVQRAEYEKSLKGALENGEHIDGGEFVLLQEYMAGSIDDLRMREALKRLHDIEAEIRSDANLANEIATLKKIVAAQGEYSGDNSYLSTLLLDKKGNCKARARFTAALIDRLYPAMEIRYQVVKVDRVMHIRTMAQVDGQWYNMEELERPMTVGDVMGSVIYKKEDPIKSYVGEKSVGTYVSPAIKINSPTKLSVSDDYENIPLPSGVSSDNIKDITSANPYSSGVPQGMAAIGMPVKDVDKVVEGETMPVYYGSRRWDAAFDVKILKPEEVNSMEARSTEWKNYIKADEPSPDSLGAPKLERWAVYEPEESPGWNGFLNRFLMNAVNHQEERMPSESSIIEHSMFQNYKMWYGWNVHDSNKDAGLLAEISRSRTLREVAYRWAAPSLKKGFVVLNVETRRKHLKTLMHLQEYLKTYDHNKEKAYLTRIKDELTYDSVFTRVAPEDYPAYLENRNSPSAKKDWGADYSKFSADEKLAYTNRYAEAFIFRRIEQGMKLEEARHWVEQGISDMEELMDEPQVTFGE